MFMNEKKKYWANVTTTNTGRNFEISAKKNNASRVEKKNVSGVERENADQLRCQSMSSLYRDEASIQSGRSLATK